MMSQIQQKGEYKVIWSSFFISSFTDTFIKLQYIDLAIPVQSEQCIVAYRCILLMLVSSIVWPTL